ncbi:hypothetical protein [Mycobacterium sp. NAZ190054]|uniref:hypothetical protein n=1 Tax=Mycobacterium sp. NAZ190054 TaxID=1747766 RepID=UPI00079896BC|nr:hypothetical protein [Mycobacterium sp. NAZ190054]KWX66987.1 hypothetical protein ASJ79_23505 [Mycobacterium sp. NAZ190054]
MNDTIWIHYALPRSSWYELADDARSELETRWKKIDSDAVEAGAEKIGTYFIRGQSDYSTTQVWSFPSYESAYEHWTAKVAAGYAEWFDFSNNVGRRT